MWSSEATTEIEAAPECIWALFADVAGWPTWNAGVTRMELDGPFATGSAFIMWLPGGQTIRSVLTAVEKDRGFTDETLLDGTRVTVCHAIDPLSARRCKVSYRTTVTGPMALEVGPMVSADFPEVLASLKRLAESR